MSETRLQNLNRINPKISSKVDEKRTLILFSPDMDFSASFSMLFQDKFKVITTTDAGILTSIIKLIKPQLLIIDAIPSASMKEWIQIYKKENPQMKIVLFYVSWYNQSDTDKKWVELVDATFCPPIDLNEVNKRINQFFLN